MANNRPKIKYIYDLPYSERTKLCNILDLNDKWADLGGKYMNFTMMDIQALRQEFLRYNSPTNELLTKWGHMNHTVDELFVLLSRMHHYQAMLILKPFVDPKFHRLLHEGEANLCDSLLSTKDDLGNSSKANLATVNLSPTDYSQEPLLQSEAAALVSNPQNNVLHSLNKNMDVGQYNLNMEKSPDRHHLPSNKVNFPKKVEEKILNTPGNDINPRRLSNASDATSAGTSEVTGNIPLISYKELSIATQNWDRHSILGKGGFGTVYKGTWKNTQVAIKKIDLKGREGSVESYQAQVEQSLRELRILNSCRHDNILPVYGYSIGGEEPCLVYQFMPNGSLEDRLLCRRGSKPLAWLQRHKIAEGTARGLQFLHNNDTPFIHGDIKSANILLDLNLEPRIGDFGLAREGPLGNYTHMKVSKVHGTKPYLPDEYLRNYKLSPKVDTYSFGIVLFELATGLRAYDEARATNKYLKEYVESFEGNQLPLMDKKGGMEDQHTFLHLIQLGKLCVSRFAKDRPGMEIVMKQLEGITTKRDMARKAQGVVGQKTPNTPYEWQLYYENRIQPGSCVNGSVSASTPAPGEINNNHTPQQTVAPIHIQQPRSLSPASNFPHIPFHQQPLQGLVANNGSLLATPIPDISRSLNTSPTSNNPSPRLSPNVLQSLTPPTPAIMYSPPSDTSQTESYTTSDDSDDSPPTSIHDQPPQYQLPEVENLYSQDLIPRITELLGRQDSEPLDSNVPTAKNKTFLFHDDN